MRKAYFNVICEEISILGGKIIHVDENLENYSHNPTMSLV